jgi:alkylation response protein AidB-like acyl-CoA dehydrogenase
LNEQEVTQQVAAVARDFAAQHIKPFVMTWDESQEFPVHVFNEMGKLGLMGVLVPEEYGGSGLSYFEYVAVIEEVAKVWWFYRVESCCTQFIVHWTYPTILQ